MLDVCLVGTGGMMPLPDRFLTGCWVEYQGGAVMIDCGEGAQVAIRKAGCKLSRLTALLLTHAHADHVAGLPGLLLSLGNTQRTAPLPIYGPKGIERVVRSLTVISQEAGFPLEIHELDGGESDILLPNGLHMACLSLRHRTPCLGYRVTLRRKGIFNPRKAERLHVPVNMYRALHAGNTVALPDRQIISPDMVLDGDRPPLSVCYMTDSLPLAQMPAFAHRADLLICEGMYPGEEMRPSMQEKMHMLFSDAASVARDGEAKRLWITHYSPACTDPAAGEDKAKAVFPGAHAAHDGEWIEL